MDCKDTSFTDKLKLYIKGCKEFESLAAVILKTDDRVVRLVTAIRLPTEPSLRSF